MKTFVHEVLRRSRTSGNILQAALCYLEAIRSKVPEILQQERMGIRAHYQPDTLIQPATDAELTREAELAGLEETSVIVDPYDPLKTVVSKDCDADFDAQDNFETSSAYSSCSLQVQPSESFTLSSTTSSLPSPLLCPRRAFLASLILASKFFQDKCYSNRAWAKLSGLPPREIGRCERALGQALEWRLWVGKTSPSAPTPRTLARAQSESSIFIPANARTSTKNIFSMQCASGTPQAPLRRCATLPEEILSRSSCDKNSKGRQTTRNVIFPAPVIHTEACDANMEDQTTDQPVSFTYECVNGISISVSNARTPTSWNLSSLTRVTPVQVPKLPLSPIRPLPPIRPAIAQFKCRPSKTACSQMPTDRKYGWITQNRNVLPFQPSQSMKTRSTVPLMAFLSKRQVSTRSRHRLLSSIRNSALLGDTACGLLVNTFRRSSPLLPTNPSLPRSSWPSFVPSCPRLPFGIYLALLTVYTLSSTPRSFGLLLLFLPLFVMKYFYPRPMFALDFPPLTEWLNITCFNIPLYCSIGFTLSALFSMMWTLQDFFKHSCSIRVLLDQGGVLKCAAPCVIHNLSIICTVKLVLQVVCKICYCSSIDSFFLTDLLIDRHDHNSTKNSGCTSWQEMLQLR